MHSTLVVQRILHNKKISQCHKICGGNNPKGFIGLWWYLSSFTVSYYSISSYSYDKTSQTALCGQCLINHQHCQACCFPTQDTWLNMASNLPCHFSITHRVLQISLKCFHLCRLRWNIFLRTQLQVLQYGFALAVFDIMALPTPTHLCYPEAKSLAR